MLPTLFLPDTLDAALRLGTAVAIGGVVGLDRGLRQKPAGFRTHALVSLGAALMTDIASPAVTTDTPWEKLIMGALRRQGVVR